jgi:hypothetical protein
MGPYMALIVPSSFYRIDAGLHALSFSPGFNVDLHKLTVFKIDTNIYRNYRGLMIVSKYFVGRGLWRLLNIDLFITSARPLKSIFLLF